MSFNRLDLHDESFLFLLSIKNFQLISEERTLTKEERDVLIMASFSPNSIHLSNREIGKRLGMPVSKVKTLIHQACEKLDASNRNEAILNAVKQREINLSELLSVNEMAEILSTVEPDTLRTIANLVCYNGMPGDNFRSREQVVRKTRRKVGILTNRERDVLVLVSYGLTNKEIAKKLCISTNAVRTFLNRAFKKLGAQKRADAVQLALKQGEICVGEISSLDELVEFLLPYGSTGIEKLVQLLEEKREKESAKSKLIRPHV